MADFEGKDWYKRSFRRNIIDMHIEDWDEKFLSRFSPEEYMEMLKIAEVQATMVYANSHVGLCNWPTKTGKIHESLKGKDVYGKILNLCHMDKISVVTYYSVLFNNWAYEVNPSWRIVDIDGNSSREMYYQNSRFNRYGLCCPNSKGYREFVVSQLEELCTNYEFEGFFIDMTFWPAICYCLSCQERYKREVNKEMPIIIDFNDEKWVAFNNKRIEWLHEYAHFISDAINGFNSDLSVEHQYSTAPKNLLLGIDYDFSKASTYAGGDLYGGFLQESFICKLYYNITENMPYEYMTSRCDSNLQDHTTLKSEGMLKLHNYINMAHGGAFLFIDAIDPVGTLNRKVYERMGSVFKETSVYEKYLGGEMVQDLAIYYSFNSKIDPAQNRLKAFMCWDDLIEKPLPHLSGVLGTARVLRENHVPFGVISKKQLGSLDNYKVLILSNIQVFDDEEVEKIFDYVRKGGKLYINSEKGCIPDRIYKDILQMVCEGTTEENMTYIAPIGDGLELFYDSNFNYPLSVGGSQIKAKSLNTKSVLAKLVLPYTLPDSYGKFVSIHSNPPGIWTDYASIVNVFYGKGEIVWTAYPIELTDKIPHKNTFLNLIKKLAGVRFSFESDAPAVVEFILFHQPDRKCYILNMINEQELLPPIPVYNFNVKLNLISKKAVKILSLPEGKLIEFKVEEDIIKFNIDVLNIFKMVMIQYN
ncbi:MAG: alpha-L-fucosidase [Actinobacteria bacterium]|nr:alpha-L-fucosidase [Actinomycetota bacterium]